MGCVPGVPLNATEFVKKEQGTKNNPGAVIANPQLGVFRLLTLIPARQLKPKLMGTFTAPAGTKVVAP